MRQDVVIVGVGEANSFERIPGRTGLRLAAESISNALVNAGLTIADIDGILSGYSLVGGGHMYSTLISEYVGLKPKYNCSLVCGGATTAIMLEHAADAIRCGTVEFVICIDADNRGSATGVAGAVAAMSGAREHPEFELPFGAHPASAEALIARRHMHEFGTTAEQLATVAVIEREHAMLNPKALRRKPLSVDDVLASPMVSSPFHGPECSLLSNYGGAVILTSATHARDLKSRPIYLAGVAESYQHRFISQCFDLTHSASKESGARAFEAAGISRSDVDFAQLYDGFAIDVIMSLEDLGFCDKGAGGPFVEARHIALGQALPVNTFGGSLSCTHGAMIPLTEAVSQLQGNCGARQVQGARIGVVQCIGNDYATHGTILLAN